MSTITTYKEDPVNPTNKFLKTIPADVIQFCISRGNLLLASKVASPCVCASAWAPETRALRNSVSRGYSPRPLTQGCGKMYSFVRQT